MENKFIKAINKARLATERKLQDIILEDEKLISVNITVEIKISNISVAEMPEGSEEHVFKSGDKAYLLSFPNSNITLTSNTYDVKENSHE
jgi:hypothetical protein